MINGSFVFLPRLKAAGWRSIWVSRRRSWGWQKRAARGKTGASRSSRGCWEGWSRRAPACASRSATARRNSASCARSERRARKGTRGQWTEKHADSLSFGVQIRRKCCITLCVHFQDWAVGEGGGYSQRKDPPSGRHAEEPAEESQAHDWTGERRMCETLQSKHLVAVLMFVKDRIGVWLCVLLVCSSRTLAWWSRRGTAWSRSWRRKWRSWRLRWERLIVSSRNYLLWLFTEV